MAGNSRHSNGRRNSDKYQQWGHQESTADTEHAGDVADGEPHPQHQEDIHGQISDGEVDLQAVRPQLRRPSTSAGFGLCIPINTLTRET